MARSLRAPLLVVTALLAGCSESVSTTSTSDAEPASDARPPGVPCSGALKGGEPCDGGSCILTDCWGGMRSEARCANGRWQLLRSSCSPPPPGADRTVGKPCAKNDECDIRGEGINVCSRGAWAGDSFYATNVCIGTACDWPNTFCDGGLGVCLPAASGSLCLPLCTFDNSESAPMGCRGKNVCVAHKLEAGDAGVTTAIGYCLGGCTSDDDCLPVGEQKCQRETGLCVRAPVVYTKSLGAPCSGAEKACNCTYNATTNLGYCTQFCRARVDACATGFACDPGLPDAFSTIPLGISGQCLKECTADADCTGLNAKCTASAGLAVKTCKP